MSGRNKGSSGRGRITYNRPDPPFLRRLRERVALAEGADPLREQHIARPPTNEKLEPEDEQPEYVVLPGSGVSEAEAMHLKHSRTGSDAGSAPPKRIVFKKPNKPTESEQQPATNKSSEHNRLKRPVPEEDDRDEGKDAGKKTKKSQNKKKQQSRLLSFADEDDAAENDDS